MFNIVYDILLEFLGCSSSVTGGRCEYHKDVIYFTPKSVTVLL